MLQEANDNAVYDEILMLQRFLGQPTANLTQIKQDYQNNIQAKDKIEKSLLDLDELIKETKFENKKIIDQVSSKIINI
jgi:hypothetical protein